MEDFLGLIIIAVIYLIAAKGNKKKKAKRQARTREKRQTQRDQTAGFEQAFERAVQAAQGVTQEQREKYGDSCEEKPLHVHEVTQAQMRAAGEGEDPCHHGTAQSEEFFPETDEAQSELAQNVLRGVIMSEILTRPCDRAALKRNRRRG